MLDSLCDVFTLSVHCFGTVTMAVMELAFKMPVPGGVVWVMQGCLASPCRHPPCLQVLAVSCVLFFLFFLFLFYSHHLPRFSSTGVSATSPCVLNSHILASILAARFDKFCQFSSLVVPTIGSRCPARPPTRSWECKSSPRICSLHPAWIATELWHSSVPSLRGFLHPL